MDFFFRRRPCLLIEDQHTHENTRKLFLNKINFLQKQYKFCFESLQKNLNIAPEFIKGALFSFDFGSKVLDSLAYLTSSSELEWKFLKFFISDTEFAYILGKFKKNYSILCIEEIFNNSDRFFFDLLGLRIIDIGTWKNLCRLKSAHEAFGLPYPNDYSYYSSKGKSVVVPMALGGYKEDFLRAEEDFQRFLGRPLSLKGCSPIVWRLLMMVDEMKNEEEIVIFLKQNNYKYDLIRRNKKNLNIPADGFAVLVEALSNLKSFSDLLFISREFELFGENAPHELLKHLIIFFLSRGDFLFDSKKLEWSKLSKDEKFINAMEMLRFINRLSQLKISLPKNFDKHLEKNFRDQCELLLGVLGDREMMRRYCLVNFFAMSIILEQIKSLETNRFYSRHYSKYIDPFLGGLEEIY